MQPIKLEEQTLEQLLKIKIQLMERAFQVNFDLSSVNAEIDKREAKEVKPDEAKA